MSPSSQLSRTGVSAVMGEPSTATAISQLSAGETQSLVQPLLPVGSASTSASTSSSTSVSKAVVEPVEQVAEQAVAKPLEVNTRVRISYFAGLGNIAGIPLFHSSLVVVLFRLCIDIR